jgi:excisionase family DNA binding protein
MSDILQPQLLTIPQTAKAWNTSRRFVEEKVRSGAVPSVKLGRLRRIHEEIVLEIQKFGLTGERHFRERPREDDGQ